MKKFFTKLKWVLIGAACVCFAVTGYLKTFRPSAESAAETGDDVAIPLDMYLIAGQSNAAGYSPVYDNETETFENVWYAGMTEKTLRSDRESYSSNSMTSFCFVQTLCKGRTWQQRKQNRSGIRHGFCVKRNVCRCK